MKNYVLLLLVSCGLIACNLNELEFDNLEFQPISGVFAVPLGFKTYTIQDLIDEQNDSLPALQEAADTSLLLLYYTDSILYNAENDFIQIDNIVGSDTLDLIGIPPTNATFTFSLPFSEPYDGESEEELDSVYYQDGELVLTVFSDADAILNYTVTFENTINRNNLQPVVFSGTVGKGEGSNTPPAQSLIDHYTKLLDGENSFTLTFDAEVVLEGGDTFTGDEIIAYEFTFQNQVFSLIYGKLGQDSINVGNQAIEIDFFDNSGDEGFFLGNPVFRFTFDNSFGVPVATDFSGITSEDENGDQNFLGGNITEANNLPVIVAAQNPGETQQTIIEINTSNSNINSLLSNSPSRLIFDVTAISNYYDDNASNFVQPGNEISGFIEVEIPLELSLKNYQQSFGYNLRGGLDTEDVDSAFLRVVTINELPFSGSLSMEIQDSTNAPIYTIPEVLVFVAPFINTSGFVIDPSGASADIPLSPEAIAAFNEGDRIEMNVTLNTPVSQTSRDIFVKILSTYKLQIELGLGGRYNYEF